MSNLNRSTTVPAFYDQEPGAPPPLPPMLTDQLKLFSCAHHLTMHIADEILPSRISTVIPSTQCIKQPQMPTPSDSVSDSGSLTLTESLSEESKIPKPPGKPGYPGHGGYTLQKALDWNPKAYTKFKKFMHHLIDKHLNMTKCTSSQNHVLLKIVRDKAVNAFPDLENYSGYWLLNDMIMMCLKYTLGCARQKEAKEAKLGVGKIKTKIKK
ncbi:hypothetical protein BDR04DRAFT_1119650 [Suillus decipiens]|nr:hypothetical protein BDR04DRAFT_1119650 [Suillus decipiens]